MNKVQFGLFKVENRTVTDLASIKDRITPAIQSACTGARADVEVFQVPQDHKWSFRLNRRSSIAPVPPPNPEPLSTLFIRVANGNDVFKKMFEGKLKKAITNRPEFKKPPGPAPEILPVEDDLDISV